MLFEPVTIDIPQASGTQQITIDAEHLIELWRAKLVPDKLYVYFALQMSFNSSAINLDLPSFCEQWAIEQPKLLAAIAWLHNKKLIDCTSRQLAIRFTSSEDE